MTINAPAAVLFAMYLVAAMKQGVSLKKISGTIQNDILKEFIAQKEWIYPPEPHLKLITDTIIYAAKNTPKWHPVSISGYHIREAGSTAVQELAFTLYNGLTYVVGLNEFTSDKEESLETLTIDPAIEERQIKNLYRVKKQRSNRDVTKALDAIKRDVEKNKNLMPVIIEAVKQYATIGEICGAMKHLYGIYEEPRALKRKTQRKNLKKKILISKVGQDGHDRGVNILIRLLKDNNFDVVYTGLRKSPEEIVEQAIQEKVNAIGISILSGAHKTWFPRIIQLLKEKKKSEITVFGGGIIPEEDKKELIAAGVQGLFPPGTLLEEILTFVKKITSG